MGDRVSIQFERSGERSVALFSHWGGMIFVKDAEQYAIALIHEMQGKTTMPLECMEPNTVMLDFIRYLFHDHHDRVMSGYYLGVDSDDGDNSDNGNWLINLDRGYPTTRYYHE